MALGWGAKNFMMGVRSSGLQSALAQPQPQPQHVWLADWARDLISGSYREMGM